MEEVEEVEVDGADDNNEGLGPLEIIRNFVLVKRIDLTWMTQRRNLFQR
ncbi:unnamed protein product [Brassica oleracea var. botrytis]